jgi:hypothetical protein
MCVFFFQRLQLEQERLSRAYSVASAAVKFYGSLSPDNSVSGSSFASRRSLVNKGEDVLGGMVQSRPFTAPGKDKEGKEGKESTSHDVRDGKKGHEKDGGSPQLNVSEIEKALTSALAADDEAARLRLQTPEATGTGTQTARTAESYEDEFFHLRPKIVQVK